MKTNIIFLALGVFTLIATLLLVAMFGPYSQDPDYLTYVGRCLADGRRLYVDIWDCKGPVVYWMSALGALISPVMGQQVVFAFAWLIAFGVVFIIARKYAGEFAGVSVFLFAVMAFGVNRFGTLGRQEAIAACFVAVGMALGLGRRTPFRCFAVGVCAGIVFLIKPTLLMFAPALGLWWGYAFFKDRDGKAFLKSVIAATVGGVCVLLVAMCMFLPDRVGEFWNGALLWNLTERNAHSLGLIKFWTVSFSMKPFVLYYGWTIIVWAVMYVAAWLLAFGVKTPIVRFFMLWATLEALAVFGYPGYCSHYIIVAFLPLALVLGCCLHERLKLGFPIVAVALIAAATCFTVGWSIPRIVRHASNYEKRQAGIEFVKREATNGGIVVYGANRTAHVLNAADVLSSQRYPGIRFWMGLASKSFDEGLALDFCNAVDAAGTHLLLVERPETLTSICLKTGWKGSGRFELAKDFPDLEVAVYRRKAP